MTCKANENRLRQCGNPALGFRTSDTTKLLAALCAITNDSNCDSCFSTSL